MGTDINNRTARWKTGVLVLASICLSWLCGCGTGPLVGMVYTKVKLPLTLDLNAAPLPAQPPETGRVIEIKEPFSGFGMYARMNSNALGDIARNHGVDRLHFADREVFSILGIWKTSRVFLHGDAAANSRDQGLTADP